MPAITTSTDSSSLSPGFGRLKAQKVKTLIHRAKQQRRRSSDEDNKLLVQHQDDAEMVSGARRSPSHSRSRGWGDGGGSFLALKSQSQNSLKEHTKSSADTNFFSAKSFKELGYADYMIQSLQKLSFVRPSHVQVAT